MAGEEKLGWYTVKRLGGGPVKFSDFVRQHELKVEVIERSKQGVATAKSKFFAQVVNGEIKTGACLSSVMGNGETPEQAIERLKMEAAGQLIVIDAYGDGRREIQCPMEWLKE